MRAPAFLLLIVVFSLPPIGISQDATGRLRLSEVVADPQTDWNQDGKVTTGDEFVEIANPTPGTVDLTGWRLFLNDTTPVTWTLSGTLAPGERRAFINPPGEVNNHAHVALLDSAGSLVDEVRYGKWGGNVAGVPDADAQSRLDESLRRNGDAWSRGHATPGAPNDQPHVDHTPPFAWADAWWDPGALVTRWNVTVVDADRSYTRVRLDLVSGNRTNATEQLLLPWGVGWIAEGNLTTPSADFEYAFLLWDDAGHALPGPRVQVRVDQTPPPAPRLLLEPWANQTPVHPLVEPVEDGGVGNVEYRVEVASDPEGPWEPAGPWTRLAIAPPLNLSTNSTLWVRATARDGFGNESPPGTPTAVTLDDQPPAPLGGFSAQGYDRLRLAWSAATDDRSGVRAVLVERFQPSPRTWTLPPESTVLEDPEIRPGDEPGYVLGSIDRAGNLGPSVEYRPQFEGLFPHVKALRASREWWGPGVLDVHADFDRPMDPSWPPTVRLHNGPEGFELAGAWLANRTTYRIRLPDSNDYPPGESRLAISDARDARGRTLWAGQSRPLRIDHEPPELSWSEAANGWINATGVELNALDDFDSSPRIRYKAWGDGQAEPDNWTEASPTVRLVPQGAQLHLVAYALDRSGHRSPERSRTFQIDRTPPRALDVHWVDASTAEIRVEDSGSGLNPAASEARQANATLPVNPNSKTGRLRVSLPDPTASVQLRMEDQTGNWAEDVVELPPHPTLEAPEAPSDAEATALTQPSPPAASTMLNPSATSMGAAAGLALPFGLGWALLQRSRRRRRPPPSLARRLLQARRKLA